MNLQVGVKILLNDIDDETYLLLKRDTARYPEVNNAWDIPGGRIDVGAPLAENLDRELREETGLALPAEVELCAAQDILKEDKHVVRLTYVARGIFSRQGITLSGEHTDAVWLGRDEIASLELLDRYVRELFESSYV